MKILQTPKAISHWRNFVSKSHSVGLVPTMGALHSAHGALISKSLNDNDFTVVSIFVNPLQFGPHEDFKRYPRPRRKDIQFLKQNRVQILFAPGHKSMYPLEYGSEVFVTGLTDSLCGAPTSRGPQHFKGVATVVAKLFNLIRPTRAYFGLKDIQQVRIIEKMNQDLNFGVEIIRCPTIRESDGLAISSRNAYLTPSERNAAPQLYSALQYGRKLLLSKDYWTVGQVLSRVKTRLNKIPKVQIEYVELVQAQSLQRLRKPKKPMVLAAAIKFPTARLIDNVIIR